MHAASCITHLLPRAARLRLQSMVRRGCKDKLQESGAICEAALAACQVCAGKDANLPVVAAMVLCLRECANAITPIA